MKSPTAVEARTTEMKPSLAAMFLMLLASSTGAQRAESFLSGDVRVRNAAVYFSLADTKQPAAVVRVADAFRDFETKAFFRIGVLPLGVLDRVTFEMGDPSQLTNTLAQIHKWLRTEGTRRIELRAVRLISSPPGSGSLEAGRARLAADGTLELFEGVDYRSGTRQIEAAHGVLRLTGEKAGQLILNARLPITNNLFAGPFTGNVRPEAHG